MLARIFVNLLWVVGILILALIIIILITAILETIFKK